MKKALQFLLVFITALIFVFGLIYIYCSFFSKIQDVIQVYLREYYFLETFIVFFDFIPALAVGSILISIGIGKKTENETLIKTLLGLLPVIIVSFVVYSVLFEIVLPSAKKSKSDIIAKSIRYEQALKIADSAIKTSDVALAERMYRIVSSIDKNGEKVMLLNRDIIILEKAKMEELSNQIVKPEDNIVNSDKYFLMAESFEKNKDYYSAHYYYILSAKLDPSRIEAQKKAAEIWNTIQSFKYLTEETDEQKLLSAKMDGYQKFLNGEFLASYKVFRELDTLYPNDKEIDNYVAITTESLKNIIFYLDELDAENLYDRTRNIFFSVTPSAGESYYVAASSVSIFSGTVYFENLEIVKVVDGVKKWDIISPFAKLVSTETPEPDIQKSNILYLRSMERLNPLKMEEPRVVGEIPPDFYGLLEVPFSKKDIEFASFSIRDLGEFPLSLLFEFAYSPKNIGIDKNIYISELLSRIMMPFAFICLMLISLSLGWNFTSRYPEQIPLGLMLLSPLIIIAALPFSDIWFFINRIIVVVFGKFLPLGLSVPIMISFYGGIILILIFFTAGAKDTEIKS